MPKEKIKSPARSGLTASDPPSSKGLTSPIASLRIISRGSLFCCLSFREIRAFFFFLEKRGIIYLTRD